MIQTENLTKLYTTDEVETTALNNISLSIDEGEFVAIMGPSGCGKSTLLNVLGLIDSADSGSYKFLGKEITRLNEKERSTLRKQNIGFIFQSFNLIDELTVFENVELPLQYQGVTSTERKKIVEELLERFGIAHRSKHYPQQLSGGQQQRVAICRAIAGNQKLIFADEPTGNLDSQNGKEVMGLLADLNKSGTTVVMVTHSENDAKYAKRVIRLKDGELVDK